MLVTASPCAAWLRGALARQPRRAGCVARDVGQAWPLTGALGSVLSVLVLVAQGVFHRDIAEKLYITAGTVKNHVSHILAKLPAENRTRAAAVARRYGLV